MFSSWEEYTTPLLERVTDKKKNIFQLGKNKKVEPVYLLAYQPGKVWNIAEKVVFYLVRPELLGEGKNKEVNLLCHKPGGFHVAENYFTVTNPKAGQPPKGAKLLLVLKSNLERGYIYDDVTVLASTAKGVAFDKGIKLGGYYKDKNDKFTLTYQDREYLVAFIKSEGYKHKSQKIKHLDLQLEQIQAALDNKINNKKQGYIEQVGKKYLVQDETTGNAYVIQKEINTDKK